MRLKISSSGKQILLSGVYVFICALLLAPAVVMAAKGDLIGLKKESAAPALRIHLGKAEIVSVEGAVADILVANPSIVDVVAVQSNKLYVVGIGVGDTNLIALDDQGEIVKSMDVHVTYDLDSIQTVVNDLFPNESVRVGAVHDQIYLTGKVSTPENASKISGMVASYVGDLQDLTGTVDELVTNLIDVRGEQQVMLQVKIVEATRSALKEFGIETDINDPNELSATTIFGGTPSNSQFVGATSSLDPLEAAFQTGGAIATTQDPAGIGRFLFNSGIQGIGSVGLFLNALEEENLVNILAEPNLTAVSGEQAGFLAGGEFPVPVGRDQVGNLVIEFREFGVSLNFRPVVLSDKRISLQLNTEVSSLDFDNAIELADTLVPGLDVRRADTTVEIPSGGSLMIAGLLQSESITGMSGLPGIAKTPVLGDLVKSDSFQRDETELVVIITPYLVEAYKEQDRADQKPEHKERPLAKAFVANVRQTFGWDDEGLFDGDGRYGYLLD